MTNPIRIIILITLICCNPLFINTKAQDKITKKVPGYHSIFISSGIDLYLKQSTEASLTIEGARPSIFHVTTSVEDSILTITALRPTYWKANNQPKVYISQNNLRVIGASGGSDIYILNAWKLDTFSINSHSGSNVFFTIDCNKLNLTANNGASIKVNGSSRTIIINATSGSDIHASKLISEDGLVYATGGSKVVLNVNKSLSAEASVQSEIIYTGNPPDKFLNTKSGSVIYQK